MNKSALATAGFGFAAGIVLFIAVDPLLPSKPKTQAPALAIASTQVVASPQGGKSESGGTAPESAKPSMPPLVRVEQQPDDQVILATKLAVAKNLKDAPSAVFSDLKRAMRPNVRGEPTDTVCGLVNAKNSYGGYSGPRGFVYFVGDGTTNIAEGSDPNALGVMVVRNFCK
jgi:hypothetical protein